MKKAMKKYGGEVPPAEDLDIAYGILGNQLQLLKEMLIKLDFTPFFGNNDLVRLQFLQEAAEYILANSVERKGEVSFLKRFKEHVKRLRSAFNICNPAGILSEEEVMWCQCMMGICSYVMKMTATEHDTESMNRHVEQMVKEAILASGVERLFEEGEEENIYGDAFVQELEDVKMPYTKFQLLCKLVAKAIKAYRETNKIQAEKFQIMLEKVIDEYNTRDKLTFTNEVTEGVVTGVVNIVEDKISTLTEKLEKILKDLKVDSEKFKELGITFEEKAFFDVLTEVRDSHKFEYSDERCIELAKKIKLLIDDTAVYADWLNNTNLRNKLASQLTVLIYKEGYPPEWDEEVFKKVLDQVENYKKNGTSKLKFTKLENVEDDIDVRNLIFNRLHMNIETDDLELQQEVIDRYGMRYPDMSLNDWRHIIEAYTPMIKQSIRRGDMSIVREDDADYRMAADDNPHVEE
jgi:type I restriction enzyme R subunit